MALIDDIKAHSGAYKGGVVTTRRRPGRPRVMPEEQTLVRVIVPDELLAEFDDLAGGKGQRSALIRELMQRYVNDSRP